MKSLMYDENKTMFMLGKNIPFKLIGKGGIARNDFNELLEVHRRYKTEYFDIGVDAFMLGYIYGKRAERTRRNEL